ncbi:hypothetical protein IWQ56_006413, partial [Coemansia nantahalensis]
MKRSALPASPGAAAAAADGENECACKPDVPRGAAGGLGLSTAEAKARLLGQLDAGRAQIVLPPHFNWRSTLVRVVLGVAGATAAALVAYGACLIARGEPVQTRGIGSVVEAGLLLVAAAVAWRVVVRESALEAHELDMRLRAVARELHGWGGSYADLRTPQLPTVTAYMVLRDGVWRDVPTLLLVEGDLVALAYGEAAPCLVGLRSSLR